MLPFLKWIDSHWPGILLKVCPLNYSHNSDKNETDSKQNPRLFQRRMKSKLKTEELEIEIKPAVDSSLNIFSKILHLYY